VALYAVAPPKNQATFLKSVMYSLCRLSVALSASQSQKFLSGESGAGKKISYIGG